MNMKTHENHDGKDKNVIEFLSFDNYYQSNENFPTSYINASPSRHGGQDLERE